MAQLIKVRIFAPKSYTIIMISTKKIMILSLAGPKRHRKHLKSRLVHGGLLERKCYECGITEWRGQPVSFDLLHVNGDGNNNRLENMTLLCPNCHSQTPNYCGRNVKRVIR